MAEFDFSMKVKIGTPEDGAGIKAEFDLVGVEITDSMGKSVNLAPDHFEELITAWDRFKSGQAVVTARAA